MHYAHDRLDDFIAALNGQLQPLFMEIRKGMAEANGTTCYVLVSGAGIMNGLAMGSGWGHAWP